MKKKLMSLVLAMTMVLSALPAAAAESSGGYGADDELAAYDQIVVFNAESQCSPCGDSIQTAKASEQNSFEQARTAVLSLNLGKQGYSYIEDACLSELDELENTPNCVLNEYTVLIPKNRAATPTYYATYSGVDFYTLVTSKSNITLEKKNFGKYSQLSQWSTGLVSLGLTLADVSTPISLAWSLVSSGLPSNYTVHTSDWLDAYCSINPTNRALYVKDGSNYKNVANREYGPFRPYTVYHYNDATASTGAKTTNYSQQYYSDVTSSNNESLLYTAYKVYTSGASAVNYLMKNRIAFTWL